MKKLIVALMVLTTLVSCGKDNKVASGAAAAPVVTNPAITVTDAAGIALGNQITSYTTGFGTARVLYYNNQYSIQQLVDNGVMMDLIYVKNTSTSTNVDPNCEKVLVIFTFCKSSSSSSTALPTGAITRGVNDVTAAVKQDELRAIINNKNPLIAIQTSTNPNYGGTVYKIIAKDGKQYVIDTSHPLQANPVGIATPGANGTFSVEYFYTVKFK